MDLARLSSDPRDPPEQPPAPAYVAAASLGVNCRDVIVTMDERAEAMLGGVNTLLDCPLADFTCERDRTTLVRLLGCARADRVALRAELGLLSADGYELRVELTVAPAPAAAANAVNLADPDVIVYLHDVSSRRSTERIAAATQAVTWAMAHSESPTVAMEAVLATLGSPMGWEVGGYWSLVAGGTALERTARWSATEIDAEQVLRRRIPLVGSHAARALRAGEARWAADLARETELTTATLAGRAGLHGAVAVPVVRAGESVGIIEFLSRSPRAPDAAILHSLTVAGAQVGELLGMLEQRIDAVEAVRRLALTDELTGLPNRRAWREAVTRELARAVRDRHAVCIAVVDLDEFKRFNDEHGHQAGDRLLAECARAWQAQLRTADVLARYGGEEFAALISAWPLHAAVDVVERLRRATPGGLTASAGIASWDGAETAEELFGRADAALYAAKQAGRDRTVTARLTALRPVPSGPAAGEPAAELRSEPTGGASTET